MPKNPVTDPITDQEIAFAHLILSGTMTDRRAAEAVGLNPDTAAYTKAKPHVRAYMIEHRAAVREKLVDQEAHGLRKLNIGRDQILNRLWELATLSHEATRGSITGQMKALAMIAAIEGLIPDRRSSPSASQPAPPPVTAEPYSSGLLRKQQHQAAGEEPGDAVAATEAQSAAPHIPEPEPAPKPATLEAPPPPAPTFHHGLDPIQPSLPGPLIPHALNRVPLTEDSGFNTLLDPTNSPRQPFFIQKGRFGPRR